jgi:hypothetical protein
MRLRQTLVVALVAYVALDLCSPFVPGAFSFDPAASVEVAHAIRGRCGTAWIAVTALDPVAVGVVVERTPRSGDAPPAIPRLAQWRPHAVGQWETASRPRADEDG